MKSENEVMKSEIVEKRRAFLINAAFFAVIIALFYFLARPFFPIIAPFFFAFLIAAILHRPVTFISKKTPFKRGIVSTIFVLAIFGLIVFLLILLGQSLWTKLKDLVSYVGNKLQSPGALAESARKWTYDFVGFLPETLRVKARDSINAFFGRIIESNQLPFTFDDVKSLLGGMFSGGGGAGAVKDAITSIPSAVISVVVFIISCVFMTIDYDKMLDFVKRLLPERHLTKLRDARTVTLSSLKKMVKAYSLIILITTTELTIGLSILKLLGIFDVQFSYILLIALIIALVDIVPVLGTGTIVIPWAVISFFQNNAKMGIGLIILYAVITVIRQIIEPKLVAGQVNMSPIVTIMAMYIGTKTLGVLGFFILPFICIVIKKLNDEGIIHLYRTADSSIGDGPEDAPPAGEIPAEAVTVAAEEEE